MILFQVEAFDFDKPDVRSRAWLPMLALRRAGLAARVVAGDVPSDVISTGKCVILTGGTGGHALNVAREATALHVPIILDIGSPDLLKDSLAGPHRQKLVEIAALAAVVTASSEALARHVESILGMEGVLVTPDPIDIEDGMLAALSANPGAMLRAAGKWIDAAARDEVAKLRRRRSTGVARKSIVWFGAGRQPNDEGGVAELLLAACDLADLAEEMLLQLDIVGRSPRAARRFLKQLPVPITFYRYAPWRVRQRLRKADLCLLPAGGEVESQARSAMRARLASALGVPVVAAVPTTPLLPAMRAALMDRSPRADQGDDARSVTAAWRRAIEAAQAAVIRRPAAGIGLGAASKLRVLFLLQQFQDIDLIVPVVEEVSACPDIEVRVAVLSKIAIPATRRMRTTCGNGAQVEFWHGADLLGHRIAPERFAVDVAVTASEGPGFGARFARAFVAASRAGGARALTLQHGLDNGGLTFGPRIRGTAFMSDLVLTWGGAHRLTEAAAPEVSAKAVPVGCPKRVFRRSDFAGFPLTDEPFIAVFENLHWRRYNDAYRDRFVRDLAATAEATPDVRFLVKPHMGGQWFVRGGSNAALPSNVEIAHPTAARWRRFTADAFLAHASAVITTPSTIALDAARYRVPAALVAYGIAAENYRPLPRLEQSGDWLTFVDQIRRGAYDRSKLDAFFADAVVAGDAVARILTVIRLAGARRSPAEMLAALQQDSHSLAAS
jgi:glycosyltransferase involved in cell wall biosynthesis